MKSISKYKQAWKASGVGAECFNPLPILKPDLIEGWQRIQIDMPERSFEKYALSNFWHSPNALANKKPFKQTTNITQEFGEPPIELFSENFKE